MTLDEWDRLTSDERRRVPLPQVVNVAAQAAQAWIESEEAGVSAIYVAERFGETYLRVFTDGAPVVYPNQTAYWHGFRLEFAPLRSINPELQEYRGELYFEK